MQEDTIKENIKYYTEVIKILFVVLLALATGILTLMLKEEKTELEYILLYLGAFLILSFTGLIIYIHIRINALLNRLP